MARPKEFDRQAALSAAMDVFWEHGFTATTMTALRKAMGIGRQSLYDTFGDKDQLFAEALGRYMAGNDGNVALRLKAGDGLEGIRAFFEDRVRMLSTGVRRGCLMINSVVELGPHDAEVAGKLAEGLVDMRAGFEVALRQAIRDGDLPAESDVGDLALFLNSQVAGMVVMAKNGSTEEELRAIVERALSALN